MYDLARARRLARRVTAEMREQGMGETARAEFRALTVRASKLFDRLYDPIHGVDTADLIEVSEMGDVTSENLCQGVHYEPTRARPLRKFLRSIDLPRDGVFVDIGCGKGRVLMIAAEQGFARVAGVDYCPEVCRVARENLEVFRRRRKPDLEFAIHQGDATDFAFEADHNVVFLFNPFGAEVLDQVLDRLEASLREAPRKVWLFYHHSLWRDRIEARGFLVGHHQNIVGCEFTAFVRETLPQASPG